MNRTNVKTKVEGLIENKTRFIETAKHGEKLNILFEKSYVFSIFAKHISAWKDLVWYLSVILNIFIVSSYKGDVGNFDARIHKVKLFNTYDEDSNLYFNSSF